MKLKLVALTVIFSAISASIPAQNQSGTSAYQIESVNQFAPGKLADGYIGDYVLENDVFRAVIARPDKPDMGEVRGGSLIDIVPAKNPSDFFAALNTTVDPLTTGSVVVYTDAEAASDASTASITLQGYIGEMHKPAPAETIAVQTRYSLIPGSSVLNIETTFTNQTTRTAWLQPADVIDWGQAGVFVEGVGYTPTTASAHFVVGAASDFALGYYTSGTRPMEGYHNTRDSVILASGAISSLAEQTEARKKIEGHVDAGLPPEYQGIGATTKPGPGLVVIPGTESLYSMRGTTPVPQPLYVPKELLKIVDGKATVTAPLARESTIFSPPDTAESDSKIRIPAGESYTFTRYLAVSDDNWAPIAKLAYTEKKVKTAELTGVVLEHNSDAPVADAIIQVGGGPDAKSPIMQVAAGPDGSFTAQLPEGDYRINPVAIGRFAPPPKENITVSASQLPKLQVLHMTPQSRLRIAISEAETPTSSPLPVKLTIISKPPFPTVNYGFNPDVTKGEANTLYLPQGFAVMPLTPGRYRLVASRGIEYDLFEKDITIAPGQELTVSGSLPHVMKELLPGMVSMDAGVVTTASAVGYASPESRIIQAACEGVSVLVSGDYGQATDLQPAVKQLGLERWVKTFRGRRELLSKDKMSADLFVYPLDDQTNAAFDEAVKKTEGLPPDIAIADLRKQFPDLIFEISRPLHPEAGYFNSFPYNKRTRSFENDNIPPPDFNAVQMFEGSKIGNIQPIYDSYIAMQLERLGKDPIGKGNTISPMGSSFSRLPYGQEIGYPRTYLYLKQLKALADITSDDIATAVKGQHLLVTNGPILLFDGADREERRFSVTPGQILDSRTTDVVLIRARVLAAPWVTLEGINTRENGLRGITVFQIKPTKEIQRYPTNDTASNVYARYIKSDTVLDAYCYSTIKSLAPVVPDDLVDYGGPVMPFAFSGPIFVDRDGDGKIIIDDTSP